MDRAKGVVPAGQLIEHDPVEHGKEQPSGTDEGRVPGGGPNPGERSGESDQEERDQRAGQPFEGGRGYQGAVEEGCGIGSGIAHQEYPGAGEDPRRVTLRLMLEWDDADKT